MAVYVCSICGYMYDEENEKVAFDDLPDSWTCPVCGTAKEYYYEASLAPDTSDEPETGAPAGGSAAAAGGSAITPGASGAAVGASGGGETVEPLLTDIILMAQTGESIIEPMRTRAPVISWDEILVMGAQLTRLPLNDTEPVQTRTVIGPRAKIPLEIETPLLITHMSYGALSKEAKITLARGSAQAKTAMSSGEGGILPESVDASYRYTFKYVPNRYSVTEEYLRRVDAVEIKLGQSAKPGMGGHLPGSKVTPEIARIRGFSPGDDIISPAHHDDIRDAADLAKKVDWLRGATGGKPIGVKLAAGDLEHDLEAVLSASPDFVTIDGRAGGTGAAPKYIKRSTSVPTLFALHRARKILDAAESDATLIITGGLRVSSDFAKALAMGADAVALGTSALIAIGCRQYRICHTGRCPRGITTHDPELRAQIDIDESARDLANYLEVSLEELRAFARLTGHDSVHGLTVDDLCTTNSEISDHTSIRHA